MAEYGFAVDAEINGVEGTFKGGYPSEVIQAIDAILSAYFPDPKEIFDQEKNDLKAEFIGEDEWFYSYLGNARSKYGIALLGARGRLIDDLKEAGMIFNPGNQTVEDLVALTNEAKEMLEENKHTL